MANIDGTLDTFRSAEVAKYSNVNLSSQATGGILLSRTTRRLLADFNGIPGGNVDQEVPGMSFLIPANTRCLIGYKLLVEVQTSQNDSEPFCEVWLRRSTDNLPIYGTQTFVTGSNGNNTYGNGLDTAFCRVLFAPTQDTTVQLMFRKLNIVDQNGSIQGPNYLAAISGDDNDSIIFFDTIQVP
jgi:hypothetical protein